MIGLMHKNYINMTKMALFDYLKTGNPAYDAIITTIMISFFGYIINYIYDNHIDINIFKLNFDDIKSSFYTKNTVVIEGKRSLISTNFSVTQSISSIYSDRFKAIWSYIILNIDKNKTIYRIKEAHSNFQSSSDPDDKRKNLDIFMVHQHRHFILDDNIFVKAEIEHEDSRDEKERVNTKTDRITINIYSYIYSVSYLKNYIDDITEKYLSSIKENRSNKRFIYLLDKVKFTDEERVYDCWREDIFESARTFNNIFFDGKKDLIEKIDFFINNRNWYYEKGIPYSLGIGLHGPPGTGKTSFIKALANYTNRHIIVLSLKIIKTKRQLEQFFFENTYNDNNEKNEVSFDKKIIVFEDIDCIGDIVLDRNNKKPKRELNKKQISDAGSINIGDVLHSICELNETGTVKISNSSNDELITLDDILNLWDGIRETPGRMLIISSNHYDKLDPALIRPGRIDITHELSNASHNTIAEMHLHLFGNKIDKNMLKKIKEYFYSPAELINIYVSNKTENEFMKRLIQNKKI
jgi:hypothetical protein